MDISAQDAARIPQRIQDKLQAFDNENQTLIAKAQQRFVTQIPSKIAFDMRSTSSSGDLIKPCERAQSISFVTRYEHLPDDIRVHLGKQDEIWYIKNLWELKHVLNDFRPIIQNQKDAVHYTRIHNVWNQMLQRSDPTQGMVIRALDVEGGDITDSYSKYITENKRAITDILNGLEFDYLYNGILQHSDPDLAQRFFADYVSGELNYLFWKHIRLLGYIKSLLRPYYTMMSVLTFPKLGGL
jgi:hypothetical protein